MERHRVTSEQAFLVLSRASQNSNRTLRDVASELVVQGTLDDTARTQQPSRRS